MRPHARRGKYCKLYLMKDILKLARAAYLPPRTVVPMVNLRNACTQLGVSAFGTEARICCPRAADAARAVAVRLLTWWACRT